MPNVLSVYDPLFYAQEAIIALEKALGMANAVYRGYDASPQQKGSTISITVPGVFSAVDAPAASAQDIKASEVQIKLDQWKEVKFGLTDKELTHTKEKIINDHIRPAAYALADAIDLSVNGLYKFVPWATNRSATTAPADLLAARKILFDNGVPLNDGLLFAEVGGQEEADLLGNSAFTQWQGSGDLGVASQVNGVIGRRFGMSVFANQNVPSHVSGVGGADVAGTIVGAHAAGVTSLSVTAFTANATNFLRAGDILSIAGQTQKYVVLNAESTGASGENTSVEIYPALAVALSGSEVVTADVPNGSTTKVQNLVFHSRFAALAMAPLTTMGDGLGARIATVSDPITNITLRSRMWYEGNNSKVFVGLDALWGVKCLDGNRAVRLRQP